MLKIRHVLILIPTTFFLLIWYQLDPPSLSSKTLSEHRNDTLEVIRLAKASMLLEKKLQTLSKENADLRTEIHRLKHQLILGSKNLDPVVHENTAIWASDELQTGTTAIVPGSTEEDFQFNTDELSDSGLDHQTLSEVQDAFYKVQQEIAVLEETARLEEWPNDLTFEDRRRQLQQDLLAVLGPENYLAGLYASGEPNRLTVLNVNPGSHAEKHGLLPGDIILAVNHNRVFNSDDFHELAETGLSNRPVELEVFREGYSLYLHIENPMADIHLYPESISPQDYYAEE